MVTNFNELPISIWYVCSPIVFIDKSVTACTCTDSLFLSQTPFSGGTLSSSLKELYSEGGIPRFYQGLPFALVQGPLTRFGDTAANVGVLALLETIPETAALPLPLKTAAGSVTAGLWRIFLMPIDSSKTAMQVEGAEG